MAKEYILKDRHGNSRTFDKETFYVRGVDGELMPFTHGTGTPVLQPLEITENGTYTAPAGVDGYNPVTVDVPVPEIKLQDKTITENGEYTADDGFDGLGKVTVNVAGSGGSSADVRYVTFMSYDGLVEYGRKAVAVGDDCADPIARGIFATPTRESDVQYNYTFYGWATTPNGAADANALKTVEEDKTVFANFAAAVRYYNAYFWDDGVLLETVPTPYGSKAIAPNVQNKEGYTHDGWNPNDLTVYGDVNFECVWVEKKGYYHIATLTGLGSVKDIAINDIGNHVAVATNVSHAVPYVWDISGNTPIAIASENTSMQVWSYDYNRDGSELIAVKYNKNGTSYTLQPIIIPVSNNVYGEPDTSITAATGKTDNYLIRYSPTKNVYSSGIPGTGYAISIEGKGVAIDDILQSMEYSPDGNLLAVGTVSSCIIYNTTDASVYKTISTGGNAIGVSFNKDGSLLAVGYYKSPYLQVINVETGAVVHDFSTMFTSAVRCCFTAKTNELVVISNAQTKIFDLSTTEPVEIENVPTLQTMTTNPFRVRTNRTGTRIAISASTTGGTVEIWGRR